MPARITWEWEPEPIEMAHRIWAVADALRDTRAPLLFAAEQTREEIVESFRTESSPDGQPWEDWSENYAPIAEAHPNIGILEQDGDLYDAATDRNAFIINGDTLFYDTSGWPLTEKGDSYGWFHQEGAPHRRTRSGNPNPLPQREFVGVSDEGANLIMGTFIGWFDRSIDLFVTARGRLGRRHMERNPLGQFTPRTTPIPFRAGRR